MQALELLKYQVEGCGLQISRVLKGIDKSAIDFRLHGEGMSIKEQVGHLADAYQAVLDAEKGVEHEWGSTKLAAEDWDGMVEEALALRAKAVEIVLQEDDTKMKMGSDFIVFHELYHVGQLATMRLQLFPAWNSYEIYG